MRVGQGNIKLYVKYSLLLDDKFKFLLVALLVSTCALIVLWTWSIRRYGKRKSYVMGAASMAPILFVLHFVPDGNLWLVMALAVLAGLGVSCAYLLPWSMLPDVVDQFEAETGHRHESVFYAYFVFFQKFGSGIALAISAFILAEVGYDNDLDVSTQPDAVDEALRLLVSVVPSALVLLSLYFLYLYPIGKPGNVHGSLVSRDRAESFARRIAEPGTVGIAEGDGEKQRLILVKNREDA
jgi:sodium-dependent lysophosphatidylcholine symporter 1